MADKLLPFIILIGVLIFIHEMGHFLFAKLFDVKVLKFSLGFGPRLFGFRKGETDYCVSAFPLGGYVKMLGEDPNEEIDPRDRGRAFGDKRLHQRFLIVFGGPAFNLLLPILIYFVFFASQATLDPSSIGTVLVGTPAWEAGLRPGDRVVSINGRTIRYWEEVQETIAASPGRPMRVELRRGDKKELVRLDVTPRSVTVPNRMGLPETVGQIGVTANYLGTRVGVADPASPAARAGLRTFDEIVAVDGKKVDRWTELATLFNGGEADKRHVLTVLRPVDVDAGFASIVRLAPVEVTLQPEPAGGATAALLEGVTDGVVALGSGLSRWLSRGVAVPAPARARDVLAEAGRVAGLPRLAELVRASLPGVGRLVDRLASASERLFDEGASRSPWRRAGASLGRALVRGEARVRGDVFWPILHGIDRALGRFGFHGIEPAELFVHDVSPGTPAELAGLRPGDRIVSLNGQGLTLWGEIEQVRRAVGAGDLSLAWDRGGRLVERALHQEERLIVDEYKNEVKQLIFGARGLPARASDERVPNEARFTRALSRAVTQTGEVIAMTALGIAHLISGKISAKNVGGVLMMGDLAAKAAKRGWESFLWLMAVISVNLGLLNLLPIPVLDGGHILFIAIEAVKRRPVSLRVREIAGLVGFSLLILLMLFAFKNDIERYWQGIVDAFR